MKNVPIRDFHFEQTLKDYLKQDRQSFKVAKILLLSLALMYVVFAFFEAGKNSIFGLILVFSVIFFLLKQDSSKMTSIFEQSDESEKWVISLSGSQLVWTSPKTMVNNTNEISFETDIDQIKEIQKSYNDRNTTVEYMFILKNGKTINPGLNSSVDMNELIEVITERGIVVKKVSDFEV